MMRMRKGMVVMAMAMAACGYGQPGRQTASQANAAGKNSEERVERELAAMSRAIEDSAGRELLAAIASNDLARVNVYLNAGADANYSGEDGTTPLGMAVGSINNAPNPRIVEALLENGADPKARWGNCGTTPFFSLVQNSTSSRAGSAALSNQVATVRLMLKHGADPNARQGLLRRSSLEYAAMRNGDIELVKALVDGGAVITDRAIEDAEDADVKRYLVSRKEEQRRQAATAGGAAQNGPEKSVTAKNDAEAIVRSITEWLEPYQGNLAIATKQVDGMTHVHGTYGVLPSIFNRINISFVVDPEAKDVLCYGYLPTYVPEERRKAMTEFIFRGEWKYGISTASIILDDEGNVMCKAWMPFESFKSQPKEAKWYLMGAVVNKLVSFSEGVASVAAGGNPANEAANVRRRHLSAIGGLGEPKEFARSAKAETKTVIERCFDKDAQITVDHGGNPWMRELAGRDDDAEDGARVGIINAHFEDVIRDMGGRYDVLPYSLVVKDGIVWNICKVPDAVPDMAIDKTAEWAMRTNQGLKCSLFSVDFDTGKVWSHYAVPVSVLPPRDEDPPRNVYMAHLMLLSVHNVASHSEELRSAVLKALEAHLASRKSVEEETGDVDEAAEEAVTFMLTTLGFDCGDGAKWGYAERRYYSIKGYESILFVECGRVRAACYGAYNISEKDDQFIKDWIAKLNQDSKEVTFCYDGNEIWCECSLPVVSLLRMTSPTEQRNALVRILTVTEKNIQANKATLRSLKTDSN